MNFGICQKENIEWSQYIEETHVLGFNHVELQIYKENVLEHLKMVSDAKTNLKKYNMTASVHSLGGTNLGEKNSRIRKVSVDIIDEAMFICEQLNAKWLTIHMGQGGFARTDSAKKAERLSIVTQELINLQARHKSVKIGIENLQCLPNSSRYTYLGDCVDDFQFLCNNSELKNCGMILDIGHSMINETDADCLELFFHKFHKTILGFHLHGNNHMIDQHSLLCESDVIKFVKLYTKYDMFEIPVLFESYNLNYNIVNKNKLMEMFTDGQLLHKKNFGE